MAAQMLLSGEDRASRRLVLPARRDLLLAVALAAPSLVQVLAAPIAPRALGVLIALGSTLPIALRRTRPALAAVLGSLPWLLPADGFLYLGYVAAFVLFYSAGAHIGADRALALLVAWGLLVSVVGGVISGIATGEYFGAVIAVLVPAAVGRVVRRQRERSRRLEELAWHLDRERERSAHAAVAQERVRIARELHDAVAHGVSVIAVQADAAEAALHQDPALAAAPLRAIRSSATDALADMRRLLGVLREGDDGSELTPQPGIASLPALLEHVRAAGVPVSLEVEGCPRPLAASADLAAYRIVQEALTNVRKHAGGAAASVRLAWSVGALEIAVADAGPGPDGALLQSAGHGLIGMRERVRIHGGELRAGRGSDGGFLVEARIPA